MMQSSLEQDYGNLKYIDIPGKDLDGVVSAIDFLKDARLNKENIDSWRYCLVIVVVVRCHGTV